MLTDPLVWWDLDWTVLRRPSPQKTALLTGWFKGDLTHDHSDPFPKMCIRPFGKDCEALGPLDRQEWMFLDSASGKSLYMG